MPRGVTLSSATYCTWQPHIWPWTCSVPFALSRRTTRIRCHGCQLLRQSANRQPCVNYPLLSLLHELLLPLNSLLVLLHVFWVVALDIVDHQVIKQYVVDQLLVTNAHLALWTLIQEKKVLIEARLTKSMLAVGRNRVGDVILANPAEYHDLIQQNICLLELVYFVLIGGYGLKISWAFCRESLKPHLLRGGDLFCLAADCFIALILCRFLHILLLLIQPYHLYALYSPLLPISINLESLNTSFITICLFSHLPETALFYFTLMPFWLEIRYDVIKW